MEDIPYLRSVAVGIWTLAGSRDEAASESGISHFIEHMLFKGTERRTAMDIADEMDKVGGQMNAYTTKELTCYYARVLDNHIDIALDVLSDMFFNSVFDPAEIEKEKNVVLEEISMYEDTPEDLVHDILQSAVWKADALGRPVLGVQETVEAFTRKDFLSYMKRHYRPENVVVSVAGKYDKNQVIEAVSRCMGLFDNTPDYIRPETAAVYASAVVTREKDVEQLHLCLAFPGIPLGSDESYTLTALNTFFGGGMSSRLFQNIREKHGLVYSIYSYPASYRGTGIYSVYAALGPQTAKEAAGLIRAEITNFFTDRMTVETLKNTKEQLKSNFILGLESTSSRMSSNARAELLLNRLLTAEQIMEKIDAVTLEGIYDLAGRIFDMGRHSVSAVGRLSGIDIAGLFQEKGL
jgi:predicted Zn-dependent peptidase